MSGAVPAGSTATSLQIRRRKRSVEIVALSWGLAGGPCVRRYNAGRMTGLDDRGQFERAATEAANIGVVSELWGFLRSNRKWWLLPILAVMVIFSLLILLSGTGVAPFIYTLF